MFRRTPLNRASAGPAGQSPEPVAPGPDSGSASRCPHCGTAVEGPINAFCCLGCEAADAIIRGAGLERYYEERTALAPRPAPAPQGDWRSVPVVTDDQGRCEARLVIDGLRCASCVWVTEHMLERTPGVAHAMVSYATGRATLRWDPARVDLPTLVRRIATLGYRPRPLGTSGMPDRGLLLRMGIAAMAALAIMGLYEGLYAGWWYGAIDPAFAALFRWTSLALATPVAIWCAEPFFAGAWHGLRRHLLHMDLPIALGIAITYGHGLVATILGKDSYLDSLAMLVALLLAGRALEAQGRRRAGEAAAALAGSVPRTARRQVHTDGPADATAPRSPEAAPSLETVPVSALRPGDLIDAGAGDELAADGRVVEGSAQVRMALLTGESAPVLVGPGDRVVAGALVADGALTVAVEAVGQETVVHRMALALEAAQDRGIAPTSTDRIAPWFTAGTLAIASMSFAAWWALAGIGPALNTTVAVLVVACPCALALAQPLATAAGLASSARRGLLLGSGDALLRLARANHVVLDKTGTVTAGAVSVVEADDVTLRIAAGLERYSGHPIARAVTDEAARRGIPLPRAHNVREIPGTGLEGVVDGTRYELRAGAPGTVELARRAVPSDTPVAVGTIRLGDAIRPDAPDTIRRLRDLGLASTLLTGDHPQVAQHIARLAGVDRVLARVEPAAKARWITGRQLQGESVLFVGDGINDGPALAAADVGVAMSSGSASSLLVADGIVSSGALSPVTAGIRAGRVAGRMVRSSLRWSIGYNVIAVGLAAAGLVNPLVAAVLMPLSSVAVIWNATRVERITARTD